jgi:hypothetical protein
MDNSVALTEVYARQHYVTPWSRVFLRKLVFTKLLKKFPVLKHNPKFIVMPKGVCETEKGRKLRFSIVFNH